MSKPKKAKVSERSKKALAIYDLLREAHKSIRRIWNEHSEVISSREYARWETALDAVDCTLYLAEGFFTREERGE